VRLQSLSSLNTDCYGSDFALGQHSGITRNETKMSKSDMYPLIKGNGLLY